MGLKIAFFLAMVASGLALTPPINNFNAGQVSPLLDARTDSPMYSGGSRTQENMISRVVGDISKRPGTTLGGVWAPVNAAQAVYPYILAPSNSKAVIFNRDFTIAQTHDTVDGCWAGAVAADGRYAVSHLQV